MHLHTNNWHNMYLHNLILKGSCYTWTSLAADNAGIPHYCGLLVFLPFLRQLRSVRSTLMRDNAIGLYADINPRIRHISREVMQQNLCRYDQNSHRAASGCSECCGKGWSLWRNVATCTSRLCSVIAALATDPSANQVQSRSDGAPLSAWSIAPAYPTQSCCIPVVSLSGRQSLRSAAVQGDLLITLTRCHNT